MNCTVWVSGSKTMMNSDGSCSETSAFGGGQLDGFDRYLLKQILEVFGQLQPRGEIDLAEILDRRQLLRIVGGDAAYARVHREGDFHHFVKRRLIVGVAKGAAIFVALHRS